jgi:hypothetical protein
MHAAEVLRHQLADARRAGASFEEAWPVALDAALATAPNLVERRRWAVVLSETVGDWRTAYSGQEASAAASAVDHLRELAAAA